MNKNNIRVYEENNSLVLFLIVPIAILAKLLEHLVLPAKYFYDSSRMLSMATGSETMSSWGGSYEVTADLFRNINVFGFDSLLEWSIFLGVIFNIIVIYLVSKNEGMTVLQSIFILACVGICNIYVFNISKDVIQFSIFLLCFIIISIEAIPNWVKIIGCSAVLYWESTFFRSYYIIMAALAIAIYVFFSMLRKIKIRFSIRNIILTVLFMYMLVFAFLAIAQVAMPSEYTEIMECKKNTTALNATSVIDDKIEHGGNLALYMQNYLINSMRMLLPVELLSSGIFYAPFLLLQICVLFYLIRQVSKLSDISDKNLLGLSVFVAFFLGSVLFEPDFGSFARHEAAAFPIIMMMVFYRKKDEDIVEESKTQSDRVVVYE